ncbi:MAG: hypothetical protein WC437_03595 [Patescibacteria group bacterium]|jgi:hypothetical protein|nr:hypothetical protein [Patescibacteria group bacterium]
MSELERSGQASGGDVRVSEGSSPEKHPNIERSDLTPREIGPGETEIIFQRHGKYERDKESDQAGKLTETAREKEARADEDFIRKQLENVPEEERGKVRFLFVGSDTKYQEGQRSLETSNIFLDTTRKILGEYGLDQSQVLNNSPHIKGGEETRPMSLIREPKMFDESWDYVQFLKEKYDKDGEGLGKGFWVAFEEDVEKEEREKRGAEGPDGLADRLQRSLAIFSRFARFYHSKHEDERLIIVATTHYDTISPFVKREVYRSDMRDYVGVDYGSGIVIKQDRVGRVDTIIGGRKYMLPEQV